MKEIIKPDNVLVDSVKRDKARGGDSMTSREW